MDTLRSPQVTLLGRSKDARCDQRRLIGADSKLSESEERQSISPVMGRLLLTTIGFGAQTFILSCLRGQKKSHFARGIADTERHLHS